MQSYFSYYLASTKVKLKMADIAAKICKIL